MTRVTIGRTSSIPVDRASVDRPPRRLRRLVGAPAPHRLSPRRLADPALGRRLLRAGAGVQLPPLHGDDPPRLRAARGSGGVSPLYPLRHGRDCGGCGRGARLAGTAAMDVHGVCHVESLALRGTELWSVDDVPPARRRRCFPARAAVAADRVCRLVRAPAGRLQSGSAAGAHRAVVGTARVGRDGHPNRRRHRFRRERLSLLCPRSRADRLCDRWCRH